jgi:hypothetical protein
MLLPAAAAWACGKQHQAFTEVYAASVDSAVGAESRGTIILLEVIYMAKSSWDKNEDLRKLFVTTVERSNWGIMWSCHLGLEENHDHLVRVEWM